MQFKYIKEINGQNKIWKEYKFIKKFGNSLNYIIIV